MVEATADPKVDVVLQNIETMVASEGGSLELLEIAPPKLSVRYTPGVNEDCPECVPTHEAVVRFLQTALEIHAPHVTDVQVS